MEAIKNNPNFDLTVQITQKILQIPTKIKACAIVISLPNETAGAVVLGDKNLSEQAKINVLLQTMSSFQIPFKQLEKYGNVDSKHVGLKGNGS